MTQPINQLPYSNQYRYRYRYLIGPIQKHLHVKSVLVPTYIVILTKHKYGIVVNSILIGDLSIELGQGLKALKLLRLFPYAGSD